MAPAAHAQVLTPAQADSVQGRAHTDFEPIGLELGNFLLHSELDDEPEYNDNIFRDNTKTSDAIDRLKPSLSLEGEIGDDTTVTLGAQADIGRYYHYHTENYEDYKFGATARQDVTDETNVGLALSREHLHVERGAFNDPGRAFGPLQYNVTTATLTPHYSTSPFLGSLKIEGKYYEFLKNGPVDESDQNEWRALVASRQGYQLDSGWTAFVEPSWQLDNYINRVDRSGINHDSQTVQGLLGVSYDATADLSLEFGLGYFEQLFFAANQQDVSGLAFNGAFVWNISEPWTLSGSLTRSSQATPTTATTQAAFVGVTSQVSSNGKLRLDYEAADNIVTYIQGAITDDQFSGTGPGANFTEDTADFELGVNYFFNEYVSLGFRYVFEVRESEVSTRRMDQNRLIFRLTAHM